MLPYCGKWYLPENRKWCEWIDEKNEFIHFCPFTTWNLYQIPLIWNSGLNTFNIFQPWGRLILQPHLCLRRKHLGWQTIVSLEMALSKSVLYRLEVTRNGGKGCSPRKAWLYELKLPWHPHLWVSKWDRYVQVWADWAMNKLSPQSRQHFESFLAGNHRIF